MHRWWRHRSLLSHPRRMPLLQWYQDQILLIQVWARQRTSRTSTRSSHPRSSWQWKGSRLFVSLLAFDSQFIYILQKPMANSLCPQRWLSRSPNGTPIWFLHAPKWNPTPHPQSPQNWRSCSKEEGWHAPELHHPGPNCHNSSFRHDFRNSAILNFVVV